MYHAAIVYQPLPILEDSPPPLTHNLSAGLIPKRDTEWREENENYQFRAGLHISPLTSGAQPPPGQRTSLTGPWLEEVNQTRATHPKDPQGAALSGDTDLEEEEKQGRVLLDALRRNLHFTSDLAKPRYIQGRHKASKMLALNKVRKNRPPSRGPIF